MAAREAVQAAIEAADPMLLEPIMRFEIHVPEDHLGFLEREGADLVPQQAQLLDVVVRQQVGPGSAAQCAPGAHVL